jgi:thioester reductase-like protein
LHQFKAALLALPDRQREQSVLQVLLLRFDDLHAAEPVHGSLAPTDRFRAAVQEAKIGPDNDIPHVSAAVITKYVSDMKLRGLL